ncbi:TLR adapter interacting with SLC15A4 on the lysosome [Synchiropus picturatus]
MLCEGRLLTMTYEEEEPATLGAEKPDLSSAVKLAPGVPLPSNPKPTLGVKNMTDARKRRPAEDIPPLLRVEVHRGGADRTSSPEIPIPAETQSNSDAPFLVPSFCQSFCENYSDLHIGGDQVLPLSTSDGDLRPCTKLSAPFLKSCDVPSAVEDSLLGPNPPGGLPLPFRGGSNRWRLGSGRDRSFLFQGRERPFSNSLLNHYLEQKIQDLYQQYMMENMNRKEAHAADPGPICPLLGSDMVLSSLDQITLQLSRDAHLEAGRAKDMVLSCLMRVAGDMQSSEISTPFLQISLEVSQKKSHDSSGE